MIEFLPPIMLAYFMVGLVMYLHHYINNVSDNTIAARHGVFWPLYLVRWLIVNFILAIKGR